MKHESIHALFLYWNDLRGERTAPERNEIEPNAIRDILADTFMLEIDAEKTYPFRLAGTRVNALFGAEQKGASFLALWRSMETENLASVLQTVADGACPVVAGAVAAPAGQDDALFEVLLLPMRHNGKTHARVLGMIKAIRNPTWLGMTPVGPLTLRSLRIVEGEELAATSHARRHAEPSRVAPQGFMSSWRGIRRVPAAERPSLRVIEGGAASPADPARVTTLRAVRDPRDRNQGSPSAR